MSTGVLSTTTVRKHRRYSRRREMSSSSTDEAKILINDDDAMASRSLSRRVLIPTQVTYQNVCESWWWSAPHNQRTRRQPFRQNFRASLHFGTHECCMWLIWACFSDVFRLRITYPRTKNMVIWLIWECLGRVWVVIDCKLLNDKLYASLIHTSSGLRFA